VEGVADRQRRLHVGEPPRERVVRIGGAGVVADIEQQPLAELVQVSYWYLVT
jgi:hypothetical protein